MTRHSFRRALRGLVATSALALFAIAIAYAWGSAGHKIINRTAVRHLPPAMSSFAADSAFYESHASDADARKVSSDTSMFAESPRHFLDIDDYPDFHNLPHDFTTLISLYGWQRVKDNGTVPWFTAWLTDTLAAQLRRGDRTAAKQTMADLGHYIGDGHQPLHVTANYNGQLTNNGGIHSRYESTMIGKHLAELVVVPDTARYISDPLEFAFQYLYEANSHVDSIMIADTYAYSVAGNRKDTSTVYYGILWQMTQGFTKRAFQTASVAVASIWYTAWVNAGLSADVDEALAAMPAAIELRQNYPNPFNPTTRFVLDARERAHATLAVYDLLGRRVATVFDGEFSPGTHAITWDAAGQASGVYLYVFQSGAHAQSGKMVLMR
jgi:hypothetical protein